MENIIEIENLVKTYGSHRGVDGISLSVRKGEIFGFLGENGAGKSTTIRSMLGLIHFDSGSIRIFGRDCAKEKQKILSQIGYMPSEAQFYSQMKVKEVIKFAADMHGMDCSEESRKLCERLKVDTEKKISELSLGNRKKVSIVCAMQHKPKLFIFDEPTSGLDPYMQTVFFDLIKEYVKEGATCLLSTHVLPEVKAYCERVAILKEGKLLCVDEVSKLTGGGSKKVVVTRNGAAEEFFYKGDINELVKKLSAEPVEDLLITEPSMEEIFLHFYEEVDSNANA